MKHSTQKNIASPIKIYGISLIISFTLSNALLNERLSTNSLKNAQASNTTMIAPVSCNKMVTEFSISCVISNLRCYNNESRGNSLQALDYGTMAIPFRLGIVQ